MISVPEMQVNIVRAYRKHIEEMYADNFAEADRLILVLKIYEWHLRRYRDRKPLNPDQMVTSKYGIRHAELLIHDIWENVPEDMQGWYMGCKERNQAQRLANLLWQIVMELTKEIQANEALYPALKPMFDRERAKYRRMLEDAGEAEAF
jgi:hypothetical protein